MRIRKLNKLIIVLIIITMLQTQIVSLTNVVWAINMEMSGETVVEEGLGIEASGEVSTEEKVENEPEEITDEELSEENTESSSDETLDELEENEEETTEETTGEQEDVVEDSEEGEEQPEDVVSEETDNNQEGEVSEESDDNQEGEVSEETTDDQEGVTEELETPTEEQIEESPEVNEEVVVEPKVELNITSENSSIYKGYLYANATSDLRYETNYNTIEEIKIEGSQNGITSVVVNEEEDKMKMITATKMALLNGIYYKKTRVSVEEFKNILGEEGVINIYDASGDFVGYIDKQSPEVNGYYEYEYIYYTNSVRFELSSPKADGTIRIINDKAIKEDTLYSREQIATFSAINVMANVEMIVGENILTASNEGDINLQETESKIEIELDKTELSTEDENEMTMTLTLKTDAERYELFENPVMEIEMPSNINEINIDGINLLYKNGLSLKNWEVLDNENGNKVLRIEMEGAQSVYTPGIVQQGTTLVVYLKANVNKLTANTSETMKLTYTNQDSVRQAYVLEGKQAEEVLMTFVAKHGMLKGMVATNESTSLVGNSYEEEVAKVNVQSNVGEQVITLRGTIVNNFEKEVNDVVIVGRIPFKGNKNGNEEELLSEFDTILSSEVTTTGNMTEIYYSEDGEAKAEDETWSQDVTDMSKYKSYKIVVKEGTLKKGERVEFVYEVTAPENLGYNLKSYATYSVIYKLDNQELKGNCTIALVTEEKELEAEDMDKQEEVEKLKIGTQVTQGGRVLTEEDTVYERQIVKYTVVVTNTSKETLRNVKLTGKAENANMYNWKYIETENYYGKDVFITRKMEEDIDGTRSQDEMVIESLLPGESTTFEYQVIAKMLPEEIPEEGIEVYGKISITAENMEEKQIETTRNKVVDGEIEVRLAWSATESLTFNGAMSNAGYPIQVYIKNITDKSLENFEVVIFMPEILEFDVKNLAIFNIPDTYSIESEKVENGQKIIVTVPYMEKNTEEYLILTPKVKSIDYAQERVNIDLRAYTQIENEIYYANDFSKPASQSETKIEYIWKSDLQKEIVDNGDIITYELKLINIGFIDSGHLLLDTVLPKGLEIVEAKILNNSEEQEVTINESKHGLCYISGNVEVIKKGESILRITAKVNDKLFEMDQETIDMKVDVYGGHINEFSTDVISYKINNKNISEEIIEEDEILEDESNDNNVENEDNVDNENKEENDSNSDNVEDNNIPNTDNNNNENTSNEDTEDKDVNNDANKEEGFNNQNNETNNIPNNEPSNTPEEKVPQENAPLQQPENQIKQEPEKEEIKKVYMISGKVWLDENKDGINKNEKGIQSVVVMLYKTTDKGNITTKVKEVATNEKGEYTFISVEEGKYVVVFSYDTSLYNSTKYRVSTATTSENSDAITKAVNLGNTKDIYGITDTITISGSGAINVDLGLVNKNEFDLSLEKYIDSATVTNSNETKTYKYEEEKNVKLEIHSKYYKNSQVDITYKIRVKNTGEVIGYVNKLVDYVPEGIKFDNNKNPEWYYGDDGNLYYKGLVGKEIKPGETKEVILVLTKVLDKGEATKVVNGAEIAESTNSIGLGDIDSTPGNEESREDDYGQVSLIITISTGKVATNIILIILTLFTVVIIVYIAKFKITKRVYR